MAKIIGEISENAISIATYNEREKINKLSLEKFKAEEKYGKESTQAQEIGKQITAIQNDIDRTYGIGSEKGMAIRAVTAALQAAAQNDTSGSLVALASPYLNQKIHEMTAGDTAKDKAVNLMAHALLSAVEFQVTGKDPLTGAIAGVTGEATAEIIARAYGKPVSELTANEKENISTLSQLAGGLAAALTAKANGTIAEQGGNFLAATSGAETAKRAVENNFSLESVINNPQEDWGASAKAQEKISEVEKRAIEQFAKSHPKLINNLKATGDVASFLADFTPVLGDAKSFAEAEDAIDYALATVGVVFPPLKSFKKVNQMARTAEKAGNATDVLKYQKEAIKQFENVKALDVNSYKNLKQRSIVGDNLDLDHIPSFAAQIKSLEKSLGRQLTREEKYKLKNEATAIAIPKEIHKKSRTYGGRNSSSQTLKDSKDLCGAQCLDLEQNKNNLLNYGFDEDDINQAIEKVKNRNSERGIK